MELTEFTLISKEDNNSLITRKSAKIKALIDVLRYVAIDIDLASEKLYIPDECEEQGFVEGYYKVGNLLYFLADMLEE